MAKRAAKASSTEAPKPAAATAYVVFARRFRPNSFAEVAGQTSVTSALRQALKTGRLAQAYLFCGPRGVGKTSLARIIAKALNCLKGSGPGGVAEEPCNACEACTAIQDGSSLDVVEMDAATNRGIEEIRSLRDNVGLAAAHLRYKVYIVDEVHMLTREAWNAFLKTLEEPPPHVKFIFATTDPNNVPETILSRCQRYDLRRIGPADIIKRLKQICGMEQVEFEEMALSRIASLARGGLRDAEGLLDQAVNLGSGKVTDAIVRDLSGSAPDELVFELLTSCAKGGTANVLLKIHTALEAGADPDDMLESLTERLRATLLSKVCGADSPLLEGQMHLKSLIADLSGLLSEDQMLMLIQLFNAARRQTRDAAQARLPLEMALIRASRASDLVELGKLVKAMEAATSAGGLPRPAGPPAREGPRPNPPGRSADTVDVRPAAEPSRSAGVSPASGSSGTATGRQDAGGTSWSQVLAGMKNQKGGAFLHGALTHARAVKFDAHSGVMELGFSTDQLLYSDALQKSHNQAAVQTVLKELFGREFALSVTRVADATPRREISDAPRIVPVAPVAAPPASRVRAAPSAPAASEPDEILADDMGSGDTEIEFDSPGDLPLPAPVSVADASEARAERVEASLPRAAPARTARGSVDPKVLKSVEEHPLIQMIVKETGGTVMNVTQTRPKKD